MEIAFETTECSRCGGEGRYSHNGEHDRCYKCGGTKGMNGREYTAAGRAALDAFNAIARPMVAVEELTVGQRILHRDVDGKRRVYTVESIEDQGRHIMLKTNRISLGVFPGTEIQLAKTDESERAAIAEVRDMPGAMLCP